MIHKISMIRLLYRTVGVDMVNGYFISPPPSSTQLWLILYRKEEPRTIKSIIVNINRPVG